MSRSIVCPKPLINVATGCIPDPLIQSFLNLNYELTYHNDGYRLTDELYVNYPYQKSTDITTMYSFGEKIEHGWNVIQETNTKTKVEEGLLKIEYYNYFTQIDTNKNAIIEPKEASTYLSNYFSTPRCGKSFYNDFTNTLFERDANIRDITNINQYLDANHDCVISEREALNFFTDIMIDESTGELIYAKSV